MNQKRYWLRGGLWVGGIYAVLFILYVLFAYSTEGRVSPSHGGGAGLGLALIPLVLSGIPISLLLEWVVHLFRNSLEQLIDHSFIGSILLLFIFNVIQWFLIGAFFGWIRGKLKK